ncbi:MAG: DUF4435 domain-containing protein [Dyadobacter sp.]|uniref:DUF4435 domain-containing protein n=1 Tax=Dyadobacter sp. TaxID=1914288 RepID=UPI0032636B0A
MDYKDLLFEKKKVIVPRARFIQLQQKYIRNEKSLHVFTENNDDFEFYRHTIAHVFTGYKIEHYSMEGKKNVKEIFNEIKTTAYNSSLLLFFVDKDYDDILNIPMIKEINFFYTKYYSIENYLVSSEILEIILGRFFTHMNSKVKIKLIDLYNVAYSLFVKQMKVFTKFILLDREKTKKAELDKFKLAYFIHIEGMVYMFKKLRTDYIYNKIIRDTKSTKLQKNLLRNKGILDILVEKCNYDKSIVSFYKLYQKYKEIELISDPKIHIRGKYELWFFIEVIKTVDQAVKKIFDNDSDISSEHEAVPRARTPISDDNIFDLVCPKMGFPEDVNNFAKRNYANLNGHS